MKVLIDDGMQIRVGTGIGKYSYSLYKSLRDIGVDVTLSDFEPVQKSKIKARIEYIKYVNSSTYLEKIKEYDLVLYTNYAIPFRRNKKTKYAVTIHDMVAFLYPETLPTSYRYYSQLMIHNSVRRADIVFTISEAAKQDILKRFPSFAHKIHAIWPGLYDDHQLSSVYGPYKSERLANIDQKPFFLFVSTVEKRKNVGMVLDAFLKLKRINKSASEYKLVIAGRPGYGYDDFVAKVNQSAFSRDVIFTGYIDDGDCYRLYNHAKAFIFPTVYEGFGFAQIECMNCHLPIILSDIPTNREVSREYGAFFDLADINTLIEKMCMITEGNYDYEHMNKLADMYIKDFNWNEVSLKYIKCFNNLLISN